MPLDHKLKSDMTGGQADTPRNVGNDAPRSEAAHFSAPEPRAVMPEPISEARPLPQETGEEQMKLLREIEAQLQTLNKNVLALENAVNAAKEPDLHGVFAKIDAARASIERMIPAAAAQPAKKEDEDSKLMALLQSILEKQEKNDRQLVQSLRDNSTFQLQVRQGMQRDLDELKEQLSGEQFQPLLKELATIYVEYQTLLDDESISARSRKNLMSLFEQLEDVLSDYGAEVIRSEIGTIRQSRTCKIIEKIPTGHQEKHNTIACSRKPGVVRDRTVLAHEFVDVYVYDPTLEAVADEELPEVITEPCEPVVLAAPAEEMTDHTPNTEDNGGNET